MGVCDKVTHVRVQAARVERLVVMLNALLRRYVEGDEQGFRVRTRTLTLTENAHLLLFSACMLVCAHDTHAGLDRSLLADIAGLVVIEAGVRASMSVILVRGSFGMDVLRADMAAQDWRMA